MARAPFQVLVIPFHQTKRGVRFAVFKRRDAGFWQPIAGGGEDEETPDQAARREAYEEAGIEGEERRLVRLDSVASIPAIHFRDRHLWGANAHVIPEHSFGIEVQSETLRICDEHTEYQWLDYQDACKIVRFDSNRTALWELDRRLSSSD